MLTPQYMKFYRVNSNKFNEIDSLWKNEIANLDDGYDDYRIPQLNHAKLIAAEIPQDKNYGIFCLEIQEEAEKKIPLIMHINTARLPSTTGVTLRVLWGLLSPKYDVGDFSENELSEVLSGMIMGILDLACGEMRADHIKIHMISTYDRGICSGIATTLKALGHIHSGEFKGNWFHMSMRQS